MSISKSSTPRIAFTPGEPAGVGPDLAVIMAQQQQGAELVAVADPALLEARARQLNLPLELYEYNAHTIPALTGAGRLAYYPVSLQKSVTAGSGDPANAAYVLETLDTAIALCQNKECQALVTGPVNKGLINQGGFEFSGHTEYLAEKNGATHPVMLLATEGLRVALATTHLPLQDVPAAITRDLLESTLQIIHADFQRFFSIAKPRIYVCGLNPHAGDMGALGQEEIDTITPTLEHLREQGLDIAGPLSADTIFSPQNRSDADVFLAMYHDQGLPVLKYAGFNHAINVTLGLNIIRTSVDHGTAFDLAGSGKVDANSLQLAISTALTMCQPGGDVHA